MSILTRGYERGGDLDTGQRVLDAPAPGKVSRTEAAGEPPAPLQAKAGGEAVRAPAWEMTPALSSAMGLFHLEAPPAQAKLGTARGGEAGSGGSGQPLPEGVRTKMERSFETDFSAVRVHESAPAVPGALASAQGTDLHFAPGQYSPHTQPGQELLGHELSHVVQQAQGRVSATRQAKGGVAVNDDPALEAEADRQGAAAARGESVRTGALVVGSVGPVQCFVPAGGEAAAVTTALDQLFGVGVDPAGARAAITAAAASLVALQQAVAAIVAAVPQADRAGLLVLLGNDTELTAQLLADARSAMDAGTPLQRLQRVLAANPGAARDRATLQPLLTAQLAIDEKILRGRTGGALGANEVPSGEKRTLIGGHSPAMLNDEAYVVESTVANANHTDYVGFRKLIRSDAGASATAVRDSAAHDPVTGCTALATAANLAVLATAAPVNNVPAALAASNPVGFAKATAAYQKKKDAYDDAHAAAVAAYGAHAALAAAAVAAAPNAAAHPNNASHVKPFIDAISDMLAGIDALVRATTVVDPGAGAIASAAFLAIKNRFESQGPVLSMKKNSTVAPNGWTDDQVLAAGDQTAAVVPTLIRRDPDNNPNTGDQCETKHQLVINGIVWVVMKEQVTIDRGPPVTFTGGRVISSYPTSASVVPADAVYPAKDADRFSTVRP